MSLIEVKNITKTFIDKSGFRIKLFEDASLSVNEIEIVSVLAPKGSGKSSLLKSIAGLSNVDSGEITSTSTAFIPSSPNSFPWWNVYENIKFANENLNDTEIKKIIELVGLEGYENHFPDNNSFGFRFRISLARALAIKSSCLIIDEPFIKINEKYRIALYDLLLKIKDELNISILFSTTNVTEAIYLSDRIYLMSMHPGKIFTEIKIDTSPKNNEYLFSKELKEIRDKIEMEFHDKELNIISDFNI